MLKRTCPPRGLAFSAEETAASSCPFSHPVAWLLPNTGAVRTAHLCLSVQLSCIESQGCTWGGEAFPQPSQLSCALVFLLLCHQSSCRLILGLLLFTVT